MSRILKFIKFGENFFLFVIYAYLVSQILQFYIDTVKQMALKQLVPGSPLRTLCLLIAGQPAEVFSTDTTSNINPLGGSMAQNSSQVM